MTFLAWDEGLADALAEPFPAEWHKTKSQGGASITFVEWHRYAHRLNALVGPQGWEIRLRFHDVGGKLITVAALSILGVTKENVGDEDEDKDNYGTACTNSFAQAMKRAAALHGMGLYMYDKAGRDAATRGRPRSETPTKSAGQGGSAQLPADGRVMGGPPPHVVAALDLEEDPTPVRQERSAAPRCPKCEGPLWDNRQKKADGQMNVRAPDFKCRDKECDGVIWPPKKKGAA
jgi:hypothetical protein